LLNRVSSLENSWVSRVHCGVRELASPHFFKHEQAQEVGDEHVVDDVIEHRLADLVLVVDERLAVGEQDQSDFLLGHFE
jgi:hypothetical protein